VPVEVTAEPVIEIVRSGGEPPPGPCGRVGGSGAGGGQLAAARRADALAGSLHLSGDRVTDLRRSIDGHEPVRGRYGPQPGLCPAVNAWYCGDVFVIDEPDLRQMEDADVLIVSASGDTELQCGHRAWTSQPETAQPLRPA
jgi:hypothetical protein